MSKIIFYIFFVLGLHIIYSQSNLDSLNLDISLKFNEQNIHFNKQYISKQKDTLSFDLIKIYLSNFEITYKDSSIKKEKNSYHLIDIEDLNSLKIKLKKDINKDIAFLKFNIGVDSLASVSGAMAGDLDATKGMYWSWQSGFLNVKIEGTSSSCKTRKSEFKFHVGGYIPPYNAMRSIQIPIPNTSNTFILNINLHKFFSEIKLKNTNTVMIPGKEAMALADISKSIFSIE